MEKLFFSIVIPTKNRSKYISCAINSVLNQTFQDFEIVIADNDDSDATRNTISMLYKDDRIKYFRTGNLSMPNNWQFAIDKANGDYIIVIQDKQALYSNALDDIKQIIDTYSSPSAIRWGIDFFDDTNPQYNTVIHAKQYSQSIKVIDSDAFLSRYKNEFFTSMDELDATLPKMNISAYSKRSVDRIREVIGRVCPPVNPDYGMAYALLMTQPNFIYFDKPLCVVTTAKTSNGKSIMTGGEMGKKFFQDMGLGIDYYCAYVPVKTISILNIILADFYRIKKIVYKTEPRFEFDKKQYFISCYKELHNSFIAQKRRNICSDISSFEPIIEWHNALKTTDLDNSLKKEILNVIKLYQITFFTRQIKSTAVKILRIFGALKLLSFIKQITNKSASVENIFYGSADEYIEQYGNSK